MNGSAPAPAAALAPAPANPFAQPSATARLLSLDVLRGVTIAFMIMVNNPGGRGAWAQMQHADWNGFTATDLVFPTFLFVVGVSIVFSFQARLARGAARKQLAWHTVTRAAILILFGIVVNNFPYFHLEHMRFYGVLQRIAICYLLVGLFYLWDRRVSTKIAALAVVLIGYWILVRWVPVPGAGMPGRDVPFLDKDQNIVAWVDRQLMPGHLYEDFPTHDARDPEGLLSDIPALGTTLLGLLAGLWLRADRSEKTKALGLAGGALACLALGYFWSVWFPLNKKMWTSSYVLVAAGWSLVAFALFYWVMDLRSWCTKGWSKVLVRPWLVLGLNAIAAYMISELLGSAIELVRFPVDGSETDALDYAHAHFFAQIPDLGWRAFAWSVSYTLLCFVPVWIMYRKKIFLKV
jgi:predicted acyltransferase